MHRRKFLQEISVKTMAAGAAAGAWIDRPLFAAAAAGRAPLVDVATAKDWQSRWEKHIIHDSDERYCDKETGEELGWLGAPFLDGFYYGYLATRDAKWVEMLIDWTDSCVKRGLKEPDGFTGWPKGDTEGLYADSLLGEAMMLRPVVLMADEILKTSALESKWAAKAR